MKRNHRRVLFLLMLAVFLISTGLLLQQVIYNQSGNDVYLGAQALASGTANRNANAQAPEETTQPELPRETEPKRSVWVPAPIENDPVAEEMAAMDLTALRLKNPDVVGWIRIPDTKINYPLMQGQDNEFYLNHTWDGIGNTMGSIFLECNNSADMTDFNTIVYGHNMANGSMFAQLHRYAEQGFRETHPYVYILCDAGVLRYEVFSTYRADVDSVVYGLSFRQEETRANLVMHALENSRIDTGIVPEAHDRILTLSTCSGAGYTNRWVVHARLKMVEVF